MSNATNVTLEYSVFFPDGFNFVKGGKLPGLFGGHKGCSGGQQSEDCFSTRLMVSFASPLLIRPARLMLGLAVPLEGYGGDVPLRTARQSVRIAVPNEAR